MNIPWYSVPYSHGYEGSFEFVLLSFEDILNLNSDLDSTIIKEASLISILEKHPFACE